MLPYYHIQIKSNIHFLFRPFTFLSMCYISKKYIYNYRSWRFIMSKSNEVEPIKKVKDIAKVKQYLLGKDNKRDYCIFVVGINVGLRAGDLLSLRICDVTDGSRIFNEVSITEQKTGKSRTFTLNKSAKDSIQLYLNTYLLLI